MGFPLMSAIFGEESLIYAMPVFVAFNLGVWTYGVYLMGGRANFSLKKVILSAPILSILHCAAPLFPGDPAPRRDRRHHRLSG